MVTEFMNKKCLVPAAILIVVIIVGLVFPKDIVRLWYEIRVDSNCVASNNKEADNIIKTRLDIIFRDNVTETQAKLFIESRGLLYGEFVYLTIFGGKWSSLVVVPKGSEIKWACILQNETTIIDKVHFDYPTKLL